MYKAPIFQTAQEYCDYAVQKIVQQGYRCVDGYDRCVYADENGNHCAVGWLLDEDSPLMKHLGSVMGLKIRNHLPSHLVPFAETLQVLQRFHDSAFKCIRVEDMQELNGLGIDTSGEHWQKWVEMGR